jgi:hypothetical protein
MGDDIPTVEPTLPPRRPVSVFREETSTKERYPDHIPVGQLIRDAVILEQERVFGTVASTITEQPTMPVTLPAKKAVKLPRFKARYYKTEPLLQHKPKLLEADASSLWPDKKVDVNKTLSIQPKFVANLGAAAEKSLMAINYFEYFARVQKKAHSVLTNKESSPEEFAAALDIISRITKCMG